LRKSSTVWIWKHDKRMVEYKIMLNCVRKLMKNYIRKRGPKGLIFKKITLKNTDTTQLVF
jgi:hypothetical protein